MCLPLRASHRISSFRLISPVVTSTMSPNGRIRISLLLRLLFMGITVEGYGIGFGYLQRPDCGSFDANRHMDVPALNPHGARVAVPELRKPHSLRISSVN